jgi:Sulfotransferase family
MICKKHNCIFVHIPKAAGQSIEHVFLKLNNLAWKARAPLLLRPNDNPELGPPRLAHLKARDYVRCKHMTEEEFAASYKFSFVRNPWDRVTSLYKYLAQREGLQFKEFVMKSLRSDLWKERYWFVGPQWEFVCDEGGNLMVDFVGRFERLQADFNQVCQALNLPPLEVPHVNKSKKKRWRQHLRPSALLGWVKKRETVQPLGGIKHYEQFYDDETRGAVAELYRKDIELFGYEFGQTARAEPLRAANSVVPL